MDTYVRRCFSVRRAGLVGSASELSSLFLPECARKAMGLCHDVRDHFSHPEIVPVPPCSSAVIFHWMVRFVSLSHLANAVVTAELIHLDYRIPSATCISNNLSTRGWCLGSRAEVHVRNLRRGVWRLIGCQKRYIAS